MKHVIRQGDKTLAEAIERAHRDYADLLAAFDTPVTCIERGKAYTVASATNRDLYHVTYSDGWRGVLVAECDCKSAIYNKGIICDHIGISIHLAICARKPRTLAPVAVYDATDDLFGTPHQLHPFDADEFSPAELDRMMEAHQWAEVA